jgi:hypothetical protein
MKFSKLAAAAVATLAMGGGLLVSTGASAAPAVPAIHKVLFTKGGTGSWNSGRFYIKGTRNPQLVVRYSYWKNGDQYGPSNFILDIVSRTDDLSVSNVIRKWGGRTTNEYPDMSYGGSHWYHVEITAEGRWRVTITQVH